MADKQRDPFERLQILCGATVIAHYVGAADAPLVIGKQRLSYVEIAQRTGLPAGRTARMISEIAQGHGATSIKDLFSKSSPHSVAVHGFGSGSLLMLLRLFASEGLDEFTWARRGEYWREDGKDAFTTWTTYKKRDQDADTRTAKTKPGPRETGYRKKAIKDQQKADRKAGI